MDDRDYKAMNEHNYRPKDQQLGKPKTFDEAVRPLMKYLAENHHPHTKAIVESNVAELVEGKQSVVTDEFIIMNSVRCTNKNLSHEKDTKKNNKNT